MTESNDWIDDQPMTLDPPGSIAVVGAGALGIEAALYGRYLGYDVTMIEAVAVGHSMRRRETEPLPMLPNRCLSPLATAAIGAQRQGAQRQVAQRQGAQRQGAQRQGAQRQEVPGEGTPPVNAANPPLPTTFGQWIEDALVPLADSDLLRGRLRYPLRVIRIVQIDVPGEEGEETSDIPPDFRLECVDEEGKSESLDAEAVILSVGPRCDILLGFEPPIPYFWRIGVASTDNVESRFLAGLREIVDLYAALAGRAGLDLYRPRRV